ncbi:hypothetical protein PZH37_14265, partial [[Eubacterium] siraeum]|nr:hypothetical protein [[Eubacterium] siraeum]
TLIQSGFTADVFLRCIECAWHILIMRVPKRSPPKTSRRTITARQRRPMRARKRTRMTISPKKSRISPNLSLLPKLPPFPMQRTRRF